MSGQCRSLSLLLVYAVPPPLPPPPNPPSPLKHTQHKDHLCFSFYFQSTAIWCWGVSRRRQGFSVRQKQVQPLLINVCAWQRRLWNGEKEKAMPSFVKGRDRLCITACFSSLTAEVWCWLTNVLSTQVAFVHLLVHLSFSPKDFFYVSQYNEEYETLQTIQLRVHRRLKEGKNVNVT